MASSGANMAIAKLFQDYSWRAGFDSLSINGGDITVNVQELNFDTSLTISRVKVTAVAKIAGGTATVEAVLARPPFSYYAQFTDSGGTKNLSGFNGTIMTTSGADVHVKGTLHGQVTIYSGRHIYVEDDMVYSQPPHLYPESNDMLVCYK
jgi:hypothetical protein